MTKTDLRKYTKEELIQVLLDSMEHGDIDYAFVKCKWRRTVTKADKEWTDYIDTLKVKYKINDTEKVFEKCTREERREWNRLYSIYRDAFFSLFKQQN